MSIYAVETYGIADSVNGVGAPANGGTNHPGDYASAQKILNFCEIVKEEHSKSQLGSVMNNMVPPSIRRQTEPVDLDIYPELDMHRLTPITEAESASHLLPRPQHHLSTANRSECQPTCRHPPASTPPPAYR